MACALHETTHADNSPPSPTNTNTNTNTRHTPCW